MSYQKIKRKVGDYAIAAAVILSMSDGSCDDAAVALTQADLWVAFVEARNRHNSISDDKRAGQTCRNKALAAIKNAYENWSRV